MNGLSALLSGLLTATLASMLTAWVWLVIQVRHGHTLLRPPVLRQVPWGLGTVAASVGTWVALNVAVALGYRAWTHAPRGSFPSVVEQMFIVSVVNALAVVTLPVVVRVLSRATPADLGLGLSVARRPVAVGAMAFLVAAWPVNLLHAACVLLWQVREKHPLEEMVRGGLTADIAYLAVISAVVLAPAFEELLFRGIVQSWLSNLCQSIAAAKAAADAPDWDGALLIDPAPVRPKPEAAFWVEWMPIVVTSALFAVAHMGQWPAPIPIFVLSLVLGFVYQRTGSLLASLVLHALFNGFSTLLLFVAMVHGQAQSARPVAPAPAAGAPAGPAVIPAEDLVARTVVTS